MDDTHALLACPYCRGRLSPSLECRSCDTRFSDEGGIADLRVRAGGRTERVREFYSAAPFPGYPPEPSLDWLRGRAGRSRYASMLDRAIPRGARIADIGCGTGQMSLYLAAGGRVVIGADLCRASLELAVDAASRMGVTGVRFVETDLFHPGLREGAFDLVHCSGVLHHTSDPPSAFVKVARLARPGGLIVLGLYHRLARLPHRVRRLAMNATRGRWIPRDRVLAERQPDEVRYRAWLRDQYFHPEEHSHTLGQLRRWFAAAGVDYLRSVPGAVIGATGEDRGLTDPEEGGWWLEDLLAQIGWLGSIAHEGGLFVAVGRKAGQAAGPALSPRLASRAGEAGPKSSLAPRASRA